MTDDHQADPAGIFENVDPKLNIFALANGMNLVKEPEERRLEWYRDRRERGIVIRGSAGGGISVAALSWDTGRREDALRKTVHEDLRPDKLTQELSATLEEALTAANEL